MLPSSKVLLKSMTRQRLHRELSDPFPSSSLRKKQRLFLGLHGNLSLIIWWVSVGQSMNINVLRNFRSVVGFGESRNNNIVDAFQNLRIGSFVRVIVVNPLHEKLPRLDLVVSCTCNCFDAAWKLRNQ